MAGNHWASSVLSSWAGWGSSYSCCTSPGYPSYSAGVTRGALTAVGTLGRRRGLIPTGFPLPDPHRHATGGPPQRHPFLLLRGRHLSGLLLLRVDRLGPVPRQGAAPGRGLGWSSPAPGRFPARIWKEKGAGVTESQSPSMAGVGRALCGSPSATPCPSRVTQSRGHSTAARGGWNISREGDSTASLGSLGQGSVTLRGKKFFLGFSWSFLCLSLCPLPLVLSLGTTGKSLAPSS